VPVPPEVAAACSFLGLDPMGIANEGKLVAIVAATARRRRHERDARARTRWRRGSSGGSSTSIPASWSPAPASGADACGRPPARRAAPEDLLMHELSICSSIAAIVTEHAAGRTVDRVVLDVGWLRQVVPDTLVYSWGLVVEGTPLEGATLEVNHIPAVIECRTCGWPPRSSSPCSAAPAARPTPRSWPAKSCPCDPSRSPRSERADLDGPIPPSHHQITTPTTTRCTSTTHDGTATTTPELGHEHRDVGDHSGYTTGGLRVDVLEKILGENDRTADANRATSVRPACASSTSCRHRVPARRPCSPRCSSTPAP
jgi:Zn finger protein HypA/HybF involved in hydrogenase expression